MIALVLLLCTPLLALCPASIGQHGYEQLPWDDDVHALAASVLEVFDVAVLPVGHVTLYGCHDSYEAHVDDRYKDIMEYVQRVVAKLSGVKNGKVISVRLLVGEAGVEPQKMHGDYCMDSVDSRGILIPITESNASGTTELLLGSEQDYMAAQQCSMMQSLQRGMKDVLKGAFGHNIVDCSEVLNRLTLVQPAFSFGDTYIHYLSGSVIHRRGPQTMARRVTLNMDYTTMDTICNEFDFINRNATDDVAPLSYVDDIFVHFSDEYQGAIGTRECGHVQGGYQVLEWNDTVKEVVQIVQQELELDSLPAGDTTLYGCHDDFAAEANGSHHHLVHAVGGLLPPGSRMISLRVRVQDSASRTEPLHISYGSSPFVAESLHIPLAPSRPHAPMELMTGNRWDVLAAQRCAQQQSIQRDLNSIYGNLINTPISNCSQHVAKLTPVRPSVAPGKSFLWNLGGVLHRQVRTEGRRVELNVDYTMSNASCNEFDFLTRDTVTNLARDESVAKPIAFLEQEESISNAEDACDDL